MKSPCRSGPLWLIHEGGTARRWSGVRMKLRNTLVCQAPRKGVASQSPAERKYCLRVSSSVLNRSTSATNDGSHFGVRPCEEKGFDLAASLLMFGVPAVMYPLKVGWSKGPCLAHDQDTRSIMIGGKGNGRRKGNAIRIALPLELFSRSSPYAAATG